MGFTKFNDSIKWEELRKNFADFWAVLEPFAEEIGGGLINFIKNITLVVKEFARNKELDAFLKDVRSWFRDFDADNMAAGIGEAFGLAINGAATYIKALISLVDFKKAGEAFSSALGGAFSKINWGKISGALSSAIKGLLDFLTGFVEKTDWQSIPAYIVQSIEEYIEGFDWQGVSESLGEFIGAAIQGVADYWLGFAEEIFGNIFNYFSDHIDEARSSGGNLIEGIFQGIIEKIADIGSWIKDNIFTPFIEGFKKAFGIASPSTVMAEQGEYIIEGLLEGIKDKIEDVKVFLNDKFAEIWQDNISPWFSAETWYELGQGIIDGISEKWEEFKTWWSETAIADWWDNHVTKWFSLDTWYELVNGIKEGIKKRFDETVLQWSIDITAWWNTHVAPWFTKKTWDDLLATVPKAFKDAFKAAANFAIDCINKVIEGVEHLVNKVIDAFNELVSGLNGILENAKFPTINFDIGHVDLGRIPSFAVGGFPEPGLFFADPYNELIGTINGNPAVTSSDEITGIRQAVNDASEREITAFERFLEIGERIVEAIDNKDLSLDDRDLAEAVLRGNERMGMAIIS